VLGISISGQREACTDEHKDSSSLSRAHSCPPPHPHRSFDERKFTNQEYLRSAARTQASKASPLSSNEIFSLKIPTACPNVITPACSSPERARSSSQAWNNRRSRTHATSCTVPKLESFLLLTCRSHVNLDPGAGSDCFFYEQILLQQQQQILQPNSRHYPKLFTWFSPLQRRALLLRHCYESNEIPISIAQPKLDAELLKRARWRVKQSPSLRRAELMAAVKQVSSAQPTDVLGLGRPKPSGRPE
jgi:hypothetical protein